MKITIVLPLEQNKSTIRFDSNSPRDRLLAKLIFGDASVERVFSVAQANDDRVEMTVELVPHKDAAPSALEARAGKHPAA